MGRANQEIGPWRSLEEENPNAVVSCVALFLQVNAKKGKFL